MNNKKEIIKINAEIVELKNMIKKMENSISKAPEGNLCCTRKGKSFQYYIKREYMGKNKIKLVKDIANREYQEKLLPLLKKKLSYLENQIMMINKDPFNLESIYLNLHPARMALVEPLVRIRSEYITQWTEVTYERWEITDENTKGKFYTTKGERVRSKSEKIIADELARYGIPYRYEYPLQLRDGGRIVTKRPDFVALNPVTLEEKVIEHLGMMDSERYYNSTLSKIDLYEQNGYLIGCDLILFHETSDKPLNTKIIDEYIETFLL